MSHLNFSYIREANPDPNDSEDSKKVWDYNYIRLELVVFHEDLYIFNFSPCETPPTPT